MCWCPSVRPDASPARVCHHVGNQSALISSPIIHVPIHVPIISDLCIVLGCSHPFRTRHETGTELGPPLRENIRRRFKTSTLNHGHAVRKGSCKRCKTFSPSLDHRLPNHPRCLFHPPTLPVHISSHPFLGHNNTPSTSGLQLLTYPLFPSL
ncbi:hypothetical protein P280DRAFT_325474 [Massarina eburnea CBS 473.64]|uniref:Uncharacterized protein n=1 Tax=Massarina eburnea CBS 473.64 TaxID=1395130 RepID=A0A6A6S2U9_9PLEO|nr:hypothetical protein P280DRAFT_325474 [Massarina eburnea CBS 473.64]